MRQASATNPGVPPSSLFTLLAAKPALAGAVLADFDAAFSNPFYDSRFDNGGTCVITRPCLLWTAALWRRRCGLGENHPRILQVTVPCIWIESTAASEPWPLNACSQEYARPCTNDRPLRLVKAQEHADSGATPAKNPGFPGCPSALRGEGGVECEESLLPYTILQAQGCTTLAGCLGLLHARASEVVALQPSASDSSAVALRPQSRTSLSPLDGLDSPDVEVLGLLATELGLFYTPT